MHPTPRNLLPLTDKSIAVLPFVNRSPDPDDEYFSDGMTEEIILALSQDEGLRVIARTSSFAFKGKNLDVRLIGQQLGVDSVVAGSVRRAGKRVRVSAELIRTKDGVSLWAKNFDRVMDDVFTLQDELSMLIADQVRENYGHFHIGEPRKKQLPRQMEAYELLLKGSYFLKRKGFEDMQQAMQYFQQAINCDPNYASAYAYLAETYLHYGGFGLLSSEEAHEAARKAARQAIKLHPKEARAHKVMAYIHLFYDWTWDQAIQAYQKALQCGLPPENEFITYYYIFLERDFERAIRVARQALLTDPLHIITHWQLGLCYYFAARFEDAIHAFDHALSLDATFGEALRWRGLALAELGRFAEAMVHIEQALEVSEGQGPAVFDRLQVLALTGQTERVRSEMQNFDFIDASDPAILYTQLGQLEDAITQLELAYEQRSVMMVSLQNYWIWDPLREHPRFQALCQRMQFPTQAFLEITSLLEPAADKVVNNNDLLDDAEVTHYRQALDEVMRATSPYLDPQLSLRILAERIELHPNKLSWLLNEHYRQNFNEYVNTFRLETFKTKALDPALGHLTLLGLAYESGFNSKTVFNNFFKKKEGLTPRKWVKAQQS